MDYVLRIDLLDTNTLNMVQGDDYYLHHDEIIMTHFGYNDSYDKYERVVHGVK